MNVEEVIDFLRGLPLSHDGKRTLELFVEGIEFLSSGLDASALECFREAFSLEDSFAMKQQRKWVEYISQKHAREKSQEEKAA